MEEVKKYLLAFGYEEEDIDKLYNQFIMKTFNEEQKLIHCKEMNDKLMSLNFSKSDIIYIFRSFNALYTYTPLKLENKISELKDLGYTDLEIKKLLKFSPSVIGLYQMSSQKRVLALITLGYTEEQIHKMIKDNPKMLIYQILKNDGVNSSETKDDSSCIEQKIIDLMALGYTKAEIIKMTVSFAGLFGYAVETIRKKIIDFEALGYEHQTVLKMTSSLAMLFSYSIDNIKQKRLDLMALGFSEEEVTMMTSAVPALFGYSKQNIENKINVLRKINLGNIIAKEPGKLITSAKLVYARYLYLTNKGINVSEGYHGKLFFQEKAFIRAYGISNKDVIKMYIPEDEGVVLK